MTADTALVAQRPARSPALVLGPALLRGSRLRHVVKDASVDRRYELGVREHFILSRLDGQRSLGDIGMEYEQEFGRALVPQDWQRLLALLGARGLLAGAAPAQSAGPAARPSSRYAMQVRVSDPVRMVDRLYTAIGWLFRPAPMTILLALLVGVEAVVVVNLPAMLAGCRVLLQHPELAVLTLLLLLNSSMLHELAHGLACRHFGGNVSEIGLRWSMAVLVMYVRAEDVLLFHSRWRRVATAAAGVPANLLFLTPFVPLWFWLPAGEVTRNWAGAMLLFGSIRALVNYLPLPGLDGHAMLGHALGITDLASESNRHLWSRDRSGHPGRLRVIYPAYLIGAVLLVLATAGALLLMAQPLLPDGWPRLAAAAAAVFGAGVLIFRVLVRQSSQGKGEPS